ncbi:hypothetical protein [Klebsiella variicola]
METLVILAVVVWILFKLVQKVTSKLYPQDSVKVQEKPDTTPATDAWGNYPKAEGHVVLFEQFRREQAQRQQAAKEAETSTAQGSGGVYVTRRFSATAINVAYAGAAPVTGW